MLGKKFKCIVIICLVFSFMLTGCGGVNVKNIDETAIIISKKGTVKDAIVESFDKDYYSENELRHFFAERIDEYNSKNNSGKVNLSELKIKKGVAKAILDFDSVETYMDFYEDTVLFYGTVNEAYDAGYTFDVSLKAAFSSETIGKSDVMEMKKSYVIITDEQSRVVCPKNIAYASANVEVIDKKNVRISNDSAGLAYIILK